MKFLCLGLVLAQTTPIPVNQQNTVTAKPSTNWNRDIGPCTCDLTVGQCDVNCCCDLDCGSSKQPWFQKCAAQSSDSNTIPYCSRYLTITNGATQLGKVTAYGGGLSPIRGAYFINTQTFIDSPSFQAQLLNEKFTPSIKSLDIKPITPNSTYSYSVPVLVRYVGVGTLAALTLPVQDSSICNDNDQPKMLVDRVNQCTRFASTATCADGSPLGFQYYVGGFNIVPDASTAGVPANDIGPLAPMCINSSGATVTCAVPVLNTLDCTNVVTKVEYSLVYKLQDLKLVISRLEPIITLGTVNFNAANVTQPIAQTFSAIFRNETATGIVYPKSGNPGYITGLKVLAGKKNNNAIDYIPNEYYGLSIIKDIANTAARRFECPSPSDILNRIPVTFGENTQSACSIYLTFTDLANSANCQTLRQNIYDLQLLTAKNIDSIGIFGNASVSNTFDWIPIVQPLPQVPQVDEKELGKCTQLITGFNIQFLYAPFGISSNPQLAIVGARYNVVMGEFQWKCQSRSDCADQTTPNNTAIVSKPFQIKSSVSFVRVPNARADPYTPVPPRIYAELPSDVWYPFDIPYQ